MLLYFFFLSPSRRFVLFLTLKFQVGFLKWKKGSDMICLGFIFFLHQKKNVVGLCMFIKSNLNQRNIFVNNVSFVFKTNTYKPEKNRRVESATQTEEKSLNFLQRQYDCKL